MKLAITKNKYSASNVSLEVSDDLTRAEAWSYGWWQFVATDAVGNIVFNHYKYSVSTGGHQSDVSTRLKRLDVTPHLHLYNTRHSLSDGLSRAIDDEITCLRSTQDELRDLIATKGTRKKKNEERAAEIQTIEYRIRDLERYRDEYIDRKQIPFSKPKRDDSAWNVERDETYKRYFLKPNGVLKRNEFAQFTARLPHWRSAPESIDALRQLLGLSKLEHTATVLSYEFAADLNEQIPHVDSAEYLELVKFCRRRNITADTLNLFALDKLHTHLTNRENRRDYTPAEPKPLPVLEPIAKLTGVDGIEIIDTEKKLRAEGRRQHHCIGGEAYMRRCRSGYQALNYRGYTFFLSPAGEILETHGRYNSSTPDAVTRELESLLRAARAA